MYIRTMFFEDVKDPGDYWIDGQKFNIQNGTRTEIYNCKSAIVEIYNKLDNEMVDMDRNADTY